MSSFNQMSAIQFAAPKFIAFSSENLLEKKNIVKRSCTGVVVIMNKMLECMDTPKFPTV